METGLIVTVATIAGALLFVVMLVRMLTKFLVKASPGQALVKTGFGLTHPKVNLSSAFVLPLLNRIETTDLTVKTVRINRRKHESLSCADGIRAEVEVDFYIKINPVEEDIRHVASTIGCARASDTLILRELFEAKFSDALKTAGAKLRFDQLYQNRREFRDEILKALGQEGAQDVVLNGFKLDDVAIQYLEQLPLEMHSEDNVLDSRGRKEIAQRTSDEVEAANKRLRQKEVTIAEQNREARLKQLQIAQDIAEKEAIQEREIKEAVARETALGQQTLAEQERLAEEAKIMKERRLRVAEEQKEQEVLAAEIERQRAIQLADEQKKQEIENAQILRERAVSVAEQEKIQQIEIARIQREAAEAEALRVKLKMLEETALQEAAKLRAEEYARTVQALEVANRQKQIQVIEAEQKAAVEKAMLQVEADVKSYELIKVAQARLESAQLDAESAEKQALAIEQVGRAEAETQRLKLEAQNVMNERVILANAITALIPLLPILAEKLMLPAEKIDSIKILNVQGMDRMAGGLGVGASDGQTNSIGGTLLNSVLGAGMVLPVVKEAMQMLRGDDRYASLFQTIQSIPGGQTLIDSLEQRPAVPPVSAALPKQPSVSAAVVGDGAAPAAA